MKSSQSNRSYVWLYAILIGIAWACAFPTANLSVLAWIVPACLFRLTVGRSWKVAGSLGFLSGFIQNLISLQWLLWMPFPLGALAGWLALSGYLALFPALWCILCSQSLCPFEAPKPSPLLQCRHALLAAGYWVTLEMLQGRLLTGFPWNFLGTTQYKLLPLTQFASIAGVVGISYLMVWTSISLLYAVERIQRHPGTRWGWIVPMALPGLMLFLVCGWGTKRILTNPLPDGAIRVALIQPNIPQTLIWDPEANEERFQKLLTLTQEALESDPHLIVWPEAAMPSFLRYDLEGFQSITNLTTAKEVWMILGADDAEPITETPDPEDYGYFNSAFLITPDGHIQSHYRKRHLVIFGEYVPLAEWIPFLRWFTPVQTGFQAGTEPAHFEMHDLQVTAAPLICFEDLFANTTRESITSDTDFLINLTNNGWFGETAAQWQHAVNASFRAIEFGLPLVRCTNNGLTCWVDRQGRILDVRFKEHESIYQAGFKICDIPLGNSASRPHTFYFRHGDWLGWFCIGTSAVYLAIRFRRSTPTPISE